MPTAATIVYAPKTPAEPPPRLAVPADHDAARFHGLKQPRQNPWAERIQQREPAPKQAARQQSRAFTQGPPRPPALSSLGYAPFLTQQAAQFDEDPADDIAGESYRRRGLDA